MQNLINISPATIDRLLKSVRKKAKPSKNKRAKPKLSRNIPVRTFKDWDRPQPGYLEIDFVVHNGGRTSGSCIHTLSVTDICTGWVECIPLLAREQSLVVEGLDLIRHLLPFPILGIDSDNDSAFINDTVLEYSRGQGIEFTRSRAFRKNDQAWIEQKNGAVIRRFTGYHRYTGVTAGQALNHLYQALRLYVNFFQPSFKLKNKTRNGAKIQRTYLRPATPCERLIEYPNTDSIIKDRLLAQRKRIDPLALLNQIRNDQSALSALASSGDSARPLENRSLKIFLSQLPYLWKEGEVRPTHRRAANLHYWRTRKDPFEHNWPDLLKWLQADPDATAKMLFQRLQQEHPGQFPDGQLRTLQRRVKAWRCIMAKNLVYSCLSCNA